jgi:hypothetical protein
MLVSQVSQNPQDPVFYMIKDQTSNLIPAKQSRRATNNNLLGTTNNLRIDLLASFWLGTISRLPYQSLKPNKKLFS